LDAFSCFFTKSRAEAGPPFVISEIAAVSFSFSFSFFSTKSIILAFSSFLFSLSSAASLIISSDSGRVSGPEDVGDIATTSEEGAAKKKEKEVEAFEG